MLKERRSNNTNMLRVFFIFVSVEVLAVASALFLWIKILYPIWGEANGVNLLILWLVIALFILLGSMYAYSYIKKSIHEQLAIILGNMNDYTGKRTSEDGYEVMDDLYYKDSLTGIRNKMSFERECQRLKWGVGSKTARFGIAIVDMNGLKKINDNYSHVQGNLAIKKLSSMICDIFSHAAVFRVGSDEFAIVLEKSSYDESGSLIDEFNRRVDENIAKEDEDPWIAVSAAIGYAEFDPLIDRTVMDVMNRAKKDMNVRKEKMKRNN